VLFDAWYPSKKLLKRSRDDGWDGLCQGKNNRRLEGKPLVRSLQPPSWQATGRVSGDLQGCVVRSRRQYSVTHRLSRSATEGRTLSRQRQEGEEVLRVLTSPRRLEGGPAGDRRSSAESSRPREGAQEHPLALCLVSYLLVERERRDHGETWRQRKRQLILRGPQSVLPALERVRNAA